MLSFEDTFSARSDTADTANYLRTSFTFLIGFPFPAQSSEFNEVYYGELGGVNDYYSSSVLFTIKSQLPIGKTFDIGLLWETFSTSFRDFYFESFPYFGKNITRTYQQQIDANSMPFMFISEYSQARTKYRSYLGFGLGVSFDNINWYENVSSDFPNDFRKSGTRYEGSVVSPATKLYFGLLLNFDKKNPKEFLGALHFEVSINYIYRSLKIYENFSKYYLQPPEEFNQRYLFLPFYLSLTTGVSFNLFHQLK